MFQMGVQSRDKKSYFKLPSEMAEDVECHRLELDLTINHNNDSVLYQETMLLPEILDFPKTLTTKVATKIPVIGFWDNSSVICVWNETKNCYEFSEKWNGNFFSKVADESNRWNGFRKVRQRFVFKL